MAQILSFPSRPSAPEPPRDMPAFSRAADTVHADTTESVARQAVSGREVRRSTTTTQEECPTRPGFHYPEPWGGVRWLPAPGGDRLARIGQGLRFATAALAWALALGTLLTAAATALAMGAA